MKNVKYAFIGSILIFLITGLVHAEKQPVWVTKPASLYAEGEYLVGVGEADTAKAAEDRAYGVIARIFKAEVDSRTTELEKYLQTETKGKTEVQRQVAIEEMTKVASEKVLEDVKIAERWQDKTTARYYALAVVNRGHASVVLTERIKNLDSEITGLLKTAQDTADKFERIRTLRRAIKALISREIYNTDLRVVNPTGKGLVSPINPADVTKELENFLSRGFNVYVTVAGNNSHAVKRSIIEGLNREGFSVLRKESEADMTDLLVIGEVDVYKADIPDPKWKYMRWCADFQLVDAKNGKTFGNISRSGKEGHLTPTEAENKAMRIMQKEIVSAVSSQLANFIYGEAKPLEAAGTGCSREKAAVSEGKKETGNALVALITQAEALLPDMSAIQYENVARDIQSKSDSATGPTIKVITPEEGKTYAPPLNIELHFITKGLSEIDLSTLKVEYLKFLSIDITERVLPYVNKEGIKIINAKFPSGTHNLKITIADKKGAVTIQKFTAVIK